MTTPAPVLVAAYDTLADWECALATAHINSPAYQRSPGRYVTRTVAATPGPLVTMGGQRIVPDIVVADVDPEESAMLMLPGGDDFGDEAAWAGLAERFLIAGRPVAAVCGATALLARHGMLDGRDHTSNAAVYLAAQPGYGGAARFVDAPAVTDRSPGRGALVTASGVAPTAFAREVLEVLDVYAPEVLQAWYELHSTGDETAFHRLMALTS